MASLGTAAVVPGLAGSLPRPLPARLLRPLLPPHPASEAAHSGGSSGEGRRKAAAPGDLAHESPSLRSQTRPF